MRKFRHKYQSFVQEKRKKMKKILKSAEAHLFLNRKNGILIEVHFVFPLPPILKGKKS